MANLDSALADQCLAATFQTLPSTTPKSLAAVSWIQCSPLAEKGLLTSIAVAFFEKYPYALPCFVGALFPAAGKRFPLLTSRIDLETLAMPAADSQFAPSPRSSFHNPYLTHHLQAPSLHSSSLKRPSHPEPSPPQAQPPLPSLSNPPFPLFAATQSTALRCLPPSLYPRRIFRVGRVRQAM